MEGLRHAIAAIRDILLIIALLMMIAVGAVSFSIIGNLRDQASMVQTPALPQDRCGGGIC